MSLLRYLEKRTRRLILRALAGSPTWRLDQPFDDRLSDSPRILLVRVDRIGDALISTPTISKLREIYPAASIDILLGEKNAVVAPLLPDVDEQVILRRGRLKSTIGKLRLNHYDVVVNLHLNRSASASLISRLVRGRYLVTYPEQGGFSEHVVTLTASLLAPFGVTPTGEQATENRPMRVTLPQESVERARAVRSTLFDGREPERCVFLNLAASNASRKWSAARWGRLAHDLADLGFHAVLCGGPGDEDLMTVALNAAEGAASALPITESYPDFAAFLAMADIVVTTDGSTVHLAAALGKPTVALYASGIAHATAWAPWGVPSRTISRPRGLLDLRPAEVLSAVENLGLECVS